MKKTISIICIAALIFTFMPLTIITMAAEPRDPYEGWDISTFDDVKVLGGDLQSRPGDTHNMWSNSWMKFSNVEFKFAPTSVFLEAAIMAPYNASYSLRLGSPTGALIARWNAAQTSGYTTFYANEAEVLITLTGTQDLYLIWEGNAHLKEMRFFSPLVGQDNASARTGKIIDVDDDRMNETLDMLIGLGIMNLYADGTFRGYDAYTTRDLALSLASIFNFNLSGNGTPGRFADMPSGKPETLAAEQAVDLGLIEMPKHKWFGPDDPISMSEFVKILVKALGHEDMVNLSGGTIDDYYTKATALGLLKGITANRDDNVTRDVAATMLYNTIMAEVMIPKAFQSDKTIYERDKTLGILGVYRKLAKNTGIVTANPLTKLDEPISNSNNEVVVNGKKYLAKDPNVAAHIGKRIEFYYYFDVETQKDAIAYARVLKSNSITEINISDIEDITPDEIKYSSGAKTRTARYSSNTAVIYNGKAVESMISLANLLSNIEMRTGTMNIIDNNGDGTADCIVIRDYKLVYLAGYSEYQNILYNKYYEYVQLNNQGWSFIDGNISLRGAYDLPFDYTCVDDTGKAVKLKNLKIGDVLLVAQSINSKDKVFTEIIVSTKSVMGTVREVNSGENTVIINNDEYKINPRFTAQVNLQQLSPGLTATFKLDTFGQIAVIESLQATVKRAILVKYAIADGGMNSRMQFKLFSEDGNMITAKTAARVTVDGVTFKDQAALSKYIADLDNPQPLPLSGPPPATDNVLISTLVMYRLNESGEIIFLDTINNNNNSTEDENDIVSKLKGESLNSRMKIHTAGTFGYYFGVIGDLVLMSPMKYSDEYDNDELYKVTNVASIKEQWGFKDAYSTQGKEYFADTFIAYTPDTMAGGISSNQFFVVESVTEGYIEGKGKTTGVHGYMDGIKKSFLFGIDPRYDKGLSNNVKPGYIIMPAFDINGHIVDHTGEKLYNALWGVDSPKILIDDNGYYVASFTSNSINSSVSSSGTGMGGVGDKDSEDDRTMFLGNAVEIFQDFLVMNTVSGFTATLKLGTPRVQIFSKEKQKIFEGTIGDIALAKSVGSADSSRIFVKTNRTTVNSILIYQ